MTCVDFEGLVDAYVDREIAANLVTEIEAHLARCSACQKQLADRLALGRLVRAIPYHVAPQRLRAAVTTRGRFRFGAYRGVLALAASVALAVSIAGAAAGLRATRERQASATAEAIVGGHVTALASGHLYDVRSTDQHTVKPWFLGKIDFSPPVEDFAAIGFPLEGGRVETVRGHAAAVLVYQRRLHPIEVFIWPATTSDAAPSARTIRGFQVHHWIAHEMSFWTVSDLNDAELVDFVTALQKP
jgi:anti-sigma factor RsiW